MSTRARLPTTEANSGGRRSPDLGCKPEVIGLRDNAIVVVPFVSEQDRRVSGWFGTVDRVERNVGGPSTMVNGVASTCIRGTRHRVVASCHSSGPLAADVAALVGKVSDSVARGSALVGFRSAVDEKVRGLTEKVFGAANDGWWGRGDGVLGPSGRSAPCFAFGAGRPRTVSAAVSSGRPPRRQ